MKLDWEMIIAVVVGMVLYKLLDRFFLESTVSQLEGSDEN